MSTSVDIESSVISIGLNSTILFIFLMGMHTVIYFGTIYVYFRRNRSKYHLVPAAITTLYLSSIVLTAVQWYGVKWDFIDNGDTQKSVFLAMLANPPWFYVATNVSNDLIFVIADGLLIWRCFYVWNRSLRIISVSLCLIAVEIALFFFVVIFHARLNDLNASPAVAIKLNDALAAVFFVSFTTTLITTILIARRIYSVSSQQGTSYRRFKHIIDIVVQSGAIYALSQLVAAISNVVPKADTFDPHVVAFQSYTQSINAVIAAISATVMVTRVALLSDDITYPSTSVHISGLQFHVHSTHTTPDIAAIAITHSVAHDNLSAREGQVAEDKA